MEPVSSINLLTPKQKLPTQFGALAGSLRRSSFIGLGAFLVSGVLVASLYIFLRQQASDNIARRDSLRSQIAANAQAEGLLFSLKQRVGIVRKLISGQTDWASIVGRVREIVPESVLTSLAVDEKHHVVLTMKTPAVEDTFPILTSIVGDVTSKRIVSPQIVSFQLDQSGLATLVVAFYPKL